MAKGRRLIALVVAVLSTLLVSSLVNSLADEFLVATLGPSPSGELREPSRLNPGPLSDGRNNTYAGTGIRQVDGDSSLEFLRAAPAPSVADECHTHTRTGKDVRAGGGVGSEPQGPSLINSTPLGAAETDTYTGNGIHEGAQSSVAEEESSSDLEAGTPAQISPMAEWTSSRRELLVTEMFIPNTHSHT